MYVSVFSTSSSTDQKACHFAIGRSNVGIGHSVRANSAGRAGQGTARSHLYRDRSSAEHNQKLGQNQCGQGRCDNRRRHTQCLNAEQAILLQPA